MDVASPLELRYAQEGHNFPSQAVMQPQSPPSVMRAPSAGGIGATEPMPSTPSTHLLVTPEKPPQLLQGLPNQNNINGTDLPPVSTSHHNQQRVAPSQQPVLAPNPLANSAAVHPTNDTKIQQPSAIPRVRPSGIPRLGNLPRPMPSSPSFDSSHSSSQTAAPIPPTTSSFPAPASGRVPPLNSGHRHPVSTPISPLSAPSDTPAPLSVSNRPSLGHMDLATPEASFGRQYSGRSRPGARSAGTGRSDRATSEHPHRFADTESDSSSIFSSSGAPKVITSKINSLKNVHHKPGGGNVAIVNEKVQLGPIKSKCGTFVNVKHKPGGGNVMIIDEKIDLSSAHSRVGSLQNAKYTPGGGNVQIITHKLEFDKTAKSKVGSLKNANHRPGGGDVQIFNESLPWLKYNRPNLPPEERARINKQISNNHSGGMNTSMHSGSTGS
ncbi:Microtubule-associated protein [Fasciolopsis buskii]|uniref:Microtubule-associated protein n=1 Tax=Fasciolopsis buskii TaxID=27845 RepID=A0A8E0S3W8_9TREM|nr:Microtubule-associated protein [Fasciolopsis buski]